MSKNEALIVKMISLLIGFFMISCQKVYDEGAEEDVEEGNLKIIAKSTSASPINYPIYLYAFTEKGNCASTQKMDSGNTFTGLRLPAGKYHIVAVSGAAKGYILPDHPSIEDEIILEGNNGATTPMMIGSADATVGGKSDNVTINLTYAVASVRVELRNVPSGTSIARVALSPLYSALSFNGKYGKSNGKLDIKCNLGTDGIWTSDTFYIFPGCGEQTTFTITLEEAGNIHNTYGYTYQGTPQANRPFIVVGSYAGDVTVEGVLLPKDWGEPVHVGFPFGTGGATSGGDEEEEGDVDTSDIPEIGDIWKDCIVADVSEPDSKGVDLLLLSLEEWETESWNGESVVADYKINGISDWRLPTYTEAVNLKKAFSGYNLMSLNERIAAEGGSEIFAGEDPRYLCYNKTGDMIYSFRFAVGTTIVNAEKNETRLFLVRAVKTYHLSLSK